MKTRINKLISTPALGAVLLLASQNSVLAETPVEVSTLGIGPVYDVTCENLTNPQMAAALPLGPNLWSCDNSGVIFNPGEEISITITGEAMDPVFIGGRITGLVTDITINCENQSNNQTVASTNLLSDWNCIDAGLAVSPGDTIVQNIIGIMLTAEGGGGSGQPPPPPPPVFDHTLVMDQACSDCHTKPPLHINSGDNCEVCHDPGGWVFPVNPPECVGLPVLGAPPCLPVDPCGVVIYPNSPSVPCVPPVDPTPVPPPVSPCNLIDPLPGEPCIPPVDPVPPPLFPCSVIFLVPGEPCIPIDPAPVPPPEQTPPCGVVDPSLLGEPCIPPADPIPVPPPVSPCNVIDPLPGEPCIPVDPLPLPIPVNGAI